MTISPLFRASSNVLFLQPSITAPVHRPSLLAMLRTLGSRCAPHVVSYLPWAMTGGMCLLLAFCLHTIRRARPQITNPPPPLIKIEHEEQAIACFAMTIGDCLSLSLVGNKSANVGVTLSFLIFHLEALKKENLVNPEKLGLLINRLYSAYLFAMEQAKLTGKTGDEYLHGRQELTWLILDILEREKRVLLPAGYYKKPAGHHILIEFTLQEGNVSAAVLNSGEGLVYHSILEGAKLKYQALHLNPIALQDFEKLPFLESLIDWHNQHCTPGQPVEYFYETLLGQWPGTLTTAGNRAHAPQKGDSCTLTPYLWLMREILGSLHGKWAKIYLECAASELLAQYVYFPSMIGCNRVREALERFNRHKGELPDRLKHRVVVASEQVQNKIKERESIARLYSSQPLTPDEPLIDSSSLSIEMLPTNAFSLEAYKHSDHLPTTAAALPEFVKHLASWFAQENSLIRTLAPDVYEMSSDSKMMVVDTQARRLYMKINEKWYQRQTHSPFQGLDDEDVPYPFHVSEKKSESGYFARHGTFWSALGASEILVLSRTYNQLLCVVTPDAIIHPENRNLVLANDYTHELLWRLSPLTMRAVPDEILAWKNETHQIVRIEIPFLQRHFEFREGRWYSSIPSGFFLDTDCRISFLDPYCHYVILRNDKGQRVVVMPLFGVEKTPHQALKNVPLVYKRIGKDLILVQYALNTQGEIKPISLFADYLIYLGLQSENYERAVQWMNVLKPRWKSPFLTMLVSPASDLSFDRHPDAVAIRLKLRLLMKEWGMESPTAFWTVDYLLYLDLHKHCIYTQLSKEEELKHIELLKTGGDLSPRNRYRLDLRAFLLGEELDPSLMKR